MDQNAPTVINLGCGYNKLIGAVNVDLYGEPDVRWDLEQTPLPFEDASADLIIMHHVLEHVKNWWPLVKDCARVLREGGDLHIYVPDWSSHSSLTYRDHINVFSLYSWHGCMPGLTVHRPGTNAWARERFFEIPLTCYDYKRTPFKKYNWMLRWPLIYLYRFLADHMTNFVWEQIFYFRKVDPEKFLELLKTKKGVTISI
jgi:SAM-dependent methyltransferase